MKTTDFIILISRTECNDYAAFIWYKCQHSVLYNYEAIQQSTISMGYSKRVYNPLNI